LSWNADDVTDRISETFAVQVLDTLWTHLVQAFGSTTACTFSPNEWNPHYRNIQDGRLTFAVKALRTE
jgi:hypothetical protein